MRRLFIGIMAVACLIVRAEAVELPLRLNYPTKVSEVVLTGVENQEVVFRPEGRDTGGRAYISIESLLELGVTLYFMFPPEFYDAVGQIDQDEPDAAKRTLPVIRKEADALSRCYGAERPAGQPSARPFTPISMPCTRRGSGPKRSR